MDTFSQGFRHFFSKTWATCITEVTQGKRANAKQVYPTLARAPTRLPWVNSVTLVSSRPSRVLQHFGEVLVLRAAGLGRRRLCDPVFKLILIFNAFFVLHLLKGVLLTVTRVIYCRINAYS
ncbi:hypothetical protein Y032_0049g1814 [Ancylostoma ceylanicum]|nr:hypothetical protein Y032_0049g1814 [Ancylostoma ceylanicum]